MADKEDELRKKTKENLDPKGWEALLEGVPPIDAQAEPPTPESDPSAPKQKEHLLRVTDESGLTSEPSIAGGSVTPEAEKAGGAGESAEDPEGPSHRKIDQEEEEETEASAQTSPSDPEIKKKSGFTLLTERLRKSPQIRKPLQYYHHLSLREQRMVLATLLFLALTFVYSVIIGPLFDHNALLNRKIEKKQEEITEMIRLRSSVVQDRGGMDRIRKIIDQRGKDFSVFAYLEQLASKAEMKEKIIYIKPQRETPVGRFKESLVQIKLEKIGMEALTRYLYQIETSEDLLYIKDLRMKQGKGGKTGLNVTFSVGTLILGS